MDASDDQSYGECEFDVSHHDVRYRMSEMKVRLKKEPGPWIAHNPARRLEVSYLKLELTDHVYSISDSIGDLVNLKHLMIDRGINLNSLPYTLPTLLHLSSLQLENCPNLSEFPSNFGNLISLRVLTIRNCGIRSLPHSLSLLKLCVLELYDCIFIQELPAGLDVETVILVGSHVKSFSDEPPNLRSLEIINCLHVDDILTTLNHFDGLLTLQIKGCDVESLPNSITRIHNLNKLEIEDYINLKTLPENSSHLVYLQCLTIVNCGLESLGGCITGLTKLKCLSIQDCVALEALPSDINTLVSLEALCIHGCTSIKFLPTLAALHNLHILSLKGCSRLDELSADFDELTDLSYLNLTDTNVQSLPSTIVKLPRLRFLQLPWCFRLETLPNDFDLKEINIYLPLSFRLDTLPAKFSVTTLDTTYQLCSSFLKDSIDRQRMVNTPPNSTHLPQPRPGHFCRNVVGETSSYASENGQTGILTSGCERGLIPSDHNDFQNAPVKSKILRGEIPLEYIEHLNNAFPEIWRW